MSIGFDAANQIMMNASRRNIAPSLPKGLGKEELFYWRLGNDFPWYSENFLKIRDKRSKLVNFQLNEAQIQFEALDKHCKDRGIMRRFIVLKARQMGMSTYAEGKIFHETSTTELTRSMIVAHEEKASVALFQMSKMYYEELPNELRPQKKYNNGKILSFENGSNDEVEKKANPGLRSNITIATAGSGEVGRGTTPTKLHISELAFWDDPETTMIGLLQGVPDTPDSLVILESTANGVGNYFHRMWKGAVAGENDFIPIFLPWFTDSTYVRDFETQAVKDAFIEAVDMVNVDSAGKEIRTYEYELMHKFHLTYEQLYWRKWAIRNKCGGDEEKFQQEYPSTPEEAFISTGRPKFSMKSLRDYQSITKPPKTRGYLMGSGFVEDDKGYIHIWKYPVPGAFYVIGGDVAEGLAHGDYSCGVVMDENLDIVAMWHGHIDADLFGQELVKLARYYNDAYLGVEINNHGLTTISAIKNMEYWNIFFQKSYDKIADKVTQSVGWKTTTKTKPLMIDKLAEYVREKWLGIYSDLVIGEMYTYIIEDNGATNAQVGCHDDTVMATAIALQLALEGKGDGYTPEVPVTERKRRSALSGYVDPLFDAEEHVPEYTI